MRTDADAEEDRAPEMMPPAQPWAAWRVTAVQALYGYRLRLRFNDATDAGVFALLRDEALSAKFTLPLVRSPRLASLEISISPRARGTGRYVSRRADRPGTLSKDRVRKIRTTLQGVWLGATLQPSNLDTTKSLNIPSRSQCALYMIIQQKINLKSRCWRHFYLRLPSSRLNDGKSQKRQTLFYLVTAERSALK